VGVKFQQPLAFLHIALPSRQVLGMPGIHEKYLEAELLQDVVEGNPIDARGLALRPSSRRNCAAILPFGRDLP
jgi:hypothetical protein